MVLNAERVKVWDIAVRVFHWSLVVLFTVSYLTGEDDSMLHIYSGYGIIGLLVFRIVWGIIGTKHARFSDFIFGTRTTLEYAKSMLAGKPRHYLGHNPLGGWMVVALLISLACTTWSGLEAYGAEGQGPLAGSQSGFIKTAHAHGNVKHDDEREQDSGAALEAAGSANDDKHRNKEEENEGDEFWGEVHEFFGNLSLFLIFLHIAGVVVSSVLHRENLVRSMITGYKVREKS